MIFGIILSLMVVEELFLCWAIYYVCSHNITPANEMFSDYVLSWGFLLLDDKEKKKNIQYALMIKNEDGRIWGKRCARDFLSKYDIKHEKLFGYVLFIGFLFFLSPFCDIDDYEHNNYSLLYLLFSISGICLIASFDFISRRIAKEISKEKDRAMMMINKGPFFPDYHMNDSYHGKIKKIFIDNYHANADKWLTPEEKDIMRKKDYNDFKYQYLSYVIDNGQSLLELSGDYKEYNLVLGTRSLRDK